MILGDSDYEGCEVVKKLMNKYISAADAAVEFHELIKYLEKEVQEEDKNEEEEEEDVVVDDAAFEA